MRRFIPRTRKGKTVAIAGLLVFAFAGAAFGYFALSTGTTSFSVGGATFTVTVDATTGPALTPGVGTDSFNYTVKNPTDETEDLSGTTVALTTDAAGGIYDLNSNSFVDGCLASWFTVSSPGLSVPSMAAGTSNSPGNPTTISMPANAGTDQSACIGLQPQILVSAL